MANRFDKRVFGLLSAAILSAQLATPVLADWQQDRYGYPQDRYGYHGYASHVRYNWDQWKYEHPKMRTAVVDGAIGTAAGALIGGLSGRGAMHGALVGAGTGAGIGLIRSSETMAEHPVAKTVSELGVGGLGLYLAAHRGHEW